MKVHSSDPVALAAWGILLAFMIAWPWAYDVWAAGHDHESMSRRLLDLFLSPVWGPFAWGLYVAVPVGFIAHELLLRRR